MTDRTRLAEDILSSAADRLCVEMRFLTPAVLSLRRIVVPGTGQPGCDGISILFHEESVISDYKEDRNLPARRIAHCVLHCMLGHVRTDDPMLMLAEDMVVEYVLDSLDTPHVSVPGIDDRRYACEKFFGRAGSTLPTAVAAELRLASGWQTDLYARTMSLDDGSVHPVEDTAGWREMSQQAMAEVEGFVRKAGLDTSGLVSVLRIRNRTRHDHRAFLRRFMTRGTGIREDIDGFDPIWYTHGLSAYGNIPLIDSLETSDDPRVEEFVIAVDTSGSTMRGPVMAFLEEAFAVLRQCNVGHGVELHVIQCDDAVRSDDVVRSEADMRALMSSFELRGGGGTDFRPVFDHVADLMAEGRLGRLRGLMYFTDGRGTYPARRPPYDTAFVFCDDRYEGHDVPPWAMRLVLGSSDLIHPQEG